MSSKIENAVSALYHAYAYLDVMSNDDKMLVGERLIKILQNNRTLQRHEVHYDDFMKSCELQTKSLTVTIHASENLPAQRYKLDDAVPF